MTSSERFLSAGVFLPASDNHRGKLSKATRDGRLALLQTATDQQVVFRVSEITDAEFREGVKAILSRLKDEVPPFEVAPDSVRLHAIINDLGKLIARRESAA